MTLILSGSDGLSDVDGSAATPAIRGTDANTGIFFGTDIIGFSEGGVESARFNASGVFTTTNDATIQGLTVGRGAGAFDSNTAVSILGLSANTTGTANTAVGRIALWQNTTGSNNSASGVGALGANTTGGSNVGFGVEALRNNTTASNNTAVGYQALYTNTTTTNITAIGYQAAYLSGTANTVAVGYQAHYRNLTGNNSVAIGYQALYGGASADADGCVAVGHQALTAVTTGDFNTALGMDTLQATTTGGTNTAVGYQALYANTTAVRNTAVGYLAGSTITVGINNTHIGSNCAASSAGVDQELVVCTGNGATGKGANTAFFTGNGGNTYNGQNSSTWSTISDQRLKKNIVDNNTGLSAIAAIRVRNFEYRLPEEVTDLPQNQAIAKAGVQLGVIAQELQAVLPECVKTESTGVISVDTDNLTWYLINAVKELTARVAQLEGN